MLPRESGRRFYLNSKSTAESGLIAPLTFPGTCDTVIFNFWLETTLLHSLVPGSIIVLDNAAFHKTTTTVVLVKPAGCKLLFLPPYSPHLNPIEKLWANMKRSWSFHAIKTLDQFLSGYQCIKE